MTGLLKWLFLGWAFVSVFISAYFVFWLIAGFFEMILSFFGYIGVSCWAISFYSDLISSFVLFYVVYFVYNRFFK